MGFGFSVPIPMGLGVWFYLVLTVASLIWLSWHYSLAVESTRWPRVQGKILKAWLKETRDEYTYYSPRVEYTYEVEGVRYTSSTMKLTGHSSTSKRRAEIIISAYHVGDLVDVWYDPRKHTRATLKPGGAGRLLVTMVVIGVVGPFLAFACTNEGRRFLAHIGIQME